MEGRINNILKDLYFLDPEFKQYEKELVPLIREFIHAKPDTAFDIAWARELRSQLMTRRGQTVEKKGIFGLLTPYMSMVSYKYGAAIAVVAIVVAVGAYTLTNKKNTSVELAFVPEVQSVGKNAFGSLVSSDGKGAAMPEADTQNAPFEADALSAPSDEGVVNTKASSSTMVPAVGYGGGGMVSDRMIAPVPYTVSYKYGGEQFELNEDEVQVLRRTHNSSSGGSLIKALSGFDFGLLDFGSFSGAQMQNISFTENRDFGYTVNISFIDGSVSINENWEKWNHPEQNCRDQKCYDSLRLTIGDVPSDEHLIAVAQSFLTDHGIALDAYGEPTVDNQWRQWYDQTEDKSQYYVPETLSVRYPLMIQGQPVFEQGGSPVGIYVSVNIRFDRVNGAWGMMSQQYESSNYPAVTDVAEVIALAERGGLYGPVYYYDNPSEQKTVAVLLGTPKRVLAKVWNYQNGAQSELLVPALQFSVIDRSGETGYMIQDSIIIPLARELLDERAGPPIGILRDVPEPALMEADSAEAATPLSNEATTDPGLNK